MVRLNEIRHGELAVTTLPPATDAGLVFIGRIHTPWTDRLVCPRQGRCPRLTASRSSKLNSLWPAHRCAGSAGPQPDQIRSVHLL
jgi:hypothetical protein